MRRFLTGLFIVFFSMCAVTACIHPVGSITREDIEDSGGGSGGGSGNPGSGNPDPGSGGDGGENENPSVIFEWA